MLERLEIVVEENIRRCRLEDYLFGRFPQLSRSYLRDVIREGNCEVNGRHENRGFRVSSRDFIEITLDLSRETAMQPAPIPLDVLYEDQDLLVVNKPAGLLVHPTNRDRCGTLLNAVSYHLNQANGFGQNRPAVRPGLVHRLDKDTSGVILIAKNLKSHRAMARQFARRTVDKRYVAVVEGILEADSGRIEAPIGRFETEKAWGVKTDGKPSETAFNVLKRGPRRTMVELFCITGRTNQLRIHLAHIGHPIVGDVARGAGHSSRLFLHSARLTFRHPRTCALVTIEAPIPGAFSHQLGL